MRNRKKSFSYAIVSGLMLLVSGCGSRHSSNPTLMSVQADGSASAVPSASSINGTQYGPLGVVLSRRAGRFVVSPPKLGYSPSVTGQSAVAMLKSSGELPTTHVAPVVEYGLLTKSDGGKIDSSGSASPSYDGIEVWLIAYQHASGLIPATGSSGTPIDHGPQSVFYVVDATSGSFLFATGDSDAAAS